MKVDFISRETLSPVFTVPIKAFGGSILKSVSKNSVVPETVILSLFWLTLPSKVTGLFTPAMVKLPDILFPSTAETVNEISA